MWLSKFRQVVRCSNDKLWYLYSFQSTRLGNELSLSVIYREKSVLYNCNCLFKGTALLLWKQNWRQYTCCLGSALKWLPRHLYPSKQYRTDSACPQMEASGWVWRRGTCKLHLVAVTVQSVHNLVPTCYMRSRSVLLKLSLD